MPNLFITTSRRTSNRVRTFVRDLCTIIPDTERFNRGGMSLSELISRIKQSSAKGVLIVSMFRGNPGTLQLLSPEGTTLFEIKIESALLRREIQTQKPSRIKTNPGVFIKNDSSEETIAFATQFAKILKVPITSVASIEAVEPSKKQEIFMWFQDLSDGKVLWTQYLTLDRIEIGPRVRAFKIRRTDIE